MSLVRLYDSAGTIVSDLTDRAYVESAVVAAGGTLGAVPYGLVRLYDSAGTIVSNLTIKNFVNNTIINAGGTLGSYNSGLVRLYDSSSDIVTDLTTKTYVDGIIANSSFGIYTNVKGRFALFSHDTYENPLINYDNYYVYGNFVLEFTPSYAGTRHWGLVSVVSSNMNACSVSNWNTDDRFNYNTTAFITNQPGVLGATGTLTITYWYDNTSKTAVLTLPVVVQHVT